MPSLISQMRNAQTQPSPQMNQSIEYVRGLMQQIQGIQNPQQALAKMIATNPQLRQYIQSGVSLETVARQMASEKGIDINQLIKQLQGGL